MGSIVLYAIITLWLTVMLLAVTAPFFAGRGASVTQKTSTIPLRPSAVTPNAQKTPEDRTAA